MSNRTRSAVVPLLTAMVSLQALSLASQWGGLSATPALAQIPDAGDQRLQIIEQLKATNIKIDALLDLLGRGQVQVKVVNATDHSGH